MKKNFSLILVDDDEDIHPLLTRVIHRINPFHKITSLYDGESLLKYLVKEAITSDDSKEATDLIILDLTMPKMDGYEILRKIRSNPRFENLKIFVMTSGTYEYDRIKSIAYGCTNFYIKPTDANELTAIIEDIFNKMDAPSFDTTVLAEE